MQLLASEELMAPRLKFTAPQPVHILVESRPVLHSRTFERLFARVSRSLHTTYREIATQDPLPSACIFHCPACKCAKASPKPHQRHNISRHLKGSIAKMRRLPMSAAHSWVPPPCVAS